MVKSNLRNIFIMDEDFSDLGEKVNNFRMDGIFASDTPESYCLSDLFTQFLIYHSILYQEPQYHGADFPLTHKALCSIFSSSGTIKSWSYTLKGNTFI